MRDLKFRAWFKKTKEYMYQGTPDVETITSFFFHLPYDPKEYELEQYTGLKDKNGKEIYEGDIFYFGPHGDCFKLCKVAWNPKRCRFEEEVYIHVDKNQILNLKPLIYALYPTSNSEVISNIHEHPELLQGGTK